VTELSSRSEPGSALRAVDSAVVVFAVLLLGALASGVAALRRRLYGS
jgi:hypothetical protein